MEQMLYDKTKRKVSSAIPGEAEVGTI